MISRPNPMLVASEVALVALSLAVVAGFSRLFIGSEYFWRLTLVALASHLIAIVMRRLGRGIMLTAVVSLIGFGVVVAAVFYPSTTSFGLPTFDTRAAAADDLRAAWSIFSEERAPVPSEVGFLLAAAAGLWLSAFLSDWAAFRLLSPVEAAAPPSVIFVFCSLFAADQHQLVSTALFIGALLAFFLTHRLARHDAGASWLGGTAAAGNGSLVRAGVILGVVALAIGIIAGPSIPGADAEAVVDIRELDDGPGSRFAISPLVDIRSRLVDLPDEEMMTVRSPVPDYWRLTSLDDFDGVKWTSSGRFSDAEGALETSVPERIASTTVVQQFDISALQQIWLPAAYEPTRLVDSGGANVQYETESGTLIIGSDRETSDGLSYTVESALPVRTPAEIEFLSSTPIPDAITERYTSLPSNYSELAAETAARIVVDADAQTRYQQALALQNHFLEYDYNLDVDNGHSNDDIDGFLENRQGYCEQFAGTYASMARSLGIPARVAVGFTWGDATGEPNVYRVRGKHAHAWPEVYLAGVGWVRFEPTPGRGAPSDAAVTGLPSAQDEPLGGTEPAPTTTVAAGPSTTGQPFGELPEDAPFPDAPAAAGGGGSPSQPSTLDRLAPVILWALLGTLAVAALVAIIRLTGERRRIARLPDGPRGDIGRAWLGATSSLDRSGLPRLASETALEYADRAGADLGDAGAALHSLADVATSADYDAGVPDAEAIEQANRAAHTVRAAAQERLSRRERLSWWIDPRPLLRSVSWPRFGAQPLNEAEA